MHVNNKKSQTLNQLFLTPIPDLSPVVFAKFEFTMLDAQFGFTLLWVGGNASIRRQMVHVLAVQAGIVVTGINIYILRT